MAHMQPYAEYMTVYEVETDHGTEIVPEDVCGMLSAEQLSQPTSFDTFRMVRDYINGHSVHGIALKKGWYGRLSADGYLDCTEWMGPFDSEEEAIAEVCAEYDVDENGDEELADDETDEGEGA